MNLIACVGKNNELGFQGDLIWKIPEDMEMFRELTTGCTVVMGFKTWESLQQKFRPLPNRRNIVLTSKDITSTHSDVDFYHSKEEVLHNIAGDEKVWIIGGAQIYKLFLPEVQVIHLTVVNDDYPEADVYFPKLTSNKWTRFTTEIDKSNFFKFETYVRKS
jgi:Dihydrofolate reductase